MVATVNCDFIIEVAPAPHMKVTIICRPDPPDPVDGFARTVSTRTFDKVDQFAVALGRALATEVAIVEGTLADAPADGLLITFGDLQLTEYPGLAPRIVLINADRSRMQRVVDGLGLAAAVEKYLYFQWRNEPSNGRGYGVYGRKDVAVVIGAEVTDMYPSEHYGMLKSEQHPDMIALLAAYLVAYLALHDEAKADGSRAPAARDLAVTDVYE